MMGEELTKVLIVGYPKSGNTWLTRLCAEIIQCPVVGYWQSEGKEVATEGEERESSFRCYKSHHLREELESYSEKPDKIIYIYRDPRDIYMSGMHYFYDLDPIKSESTTWLSRLVNRVFKELIGKARMSEKMSRALLYGDERVHFHCRMSWMEHLNSYEQDPAVLIIKYEDLLGDTSAEAQRICAYLGIERSDTEINNAIQRQSFSKVQERHAQSDDREKREFLRKGVSGQWKTGMPKRIQMEFQKVLGEEMNRLNYSS